MSRGKAVRPSDRWMSVSDVSDDLGFAANVIRRMARRGKFRSAHKIGGRWLFSRQVYEAELHGEHQSTTNIAELEALNPGGK